MLTTLPMNLAPTNPPLTPPRRGTGQPVLLPSWEGLGVGSGAPCAHKIRGSLSSVLSPLLRRGERKQKGGDILDARCCSLSLRVLGNLRLCRRTREVRQFREWS